MKQDFDPSSPPRVLSERENRVIDKHLQEKPECQDGDIVSQWGSYCSTYRKTTGKLWVFDSSRGGISKQELYFYSVDSTVGAITCSHPIKLWDLRRKLSRRETARIQGFPESMILPKQSYNKLFGNAVCVPCAKFAISRVCSDVDEAVRHLDVCAGIGGFSFALKQVCPSAITVGFSEVFPSAVKNYELNFPDAPNLGDASKISSRVGGKGWPRCDLLTAGFPCQPFSRCNTLISRDDHKNSDFFQTVLDAIDESEADRIVLENVANLMKDQVRFGQILTHLKDQGFYVTYRVLNSVDFNVCQKRKRVYIVGSKKKEPLPLDPPACTEKALCIRDIIKTDP